MLSSLPSLVKKSMKDITNQNWNALKRQDILNIINNVIWDLTAPDCWKLIQRRNNNSTAFSSYKNNLQKDYLLRKTVWMFHLHFRGTYILMTRRRSLPAQTGFLLLNPPLQTYHMWPFYVLCWIKNSLHDQFTRKQINEGWTRHCVTFIGLIQFLIPW